MTVNFGKTLKEVKEKVVLHVDKSNNYKVLPSDVTLWNVTISPLDSIKVIVDFWEDVGASFSVTGKF